MDHQASRVDVWSWRLLMFTFAATAGVILTGVSPHFFPAR
jgi:hypothetical protein